MGKAGAGEEGRVGNGRIKRCLTTDFFSITIV